MACVTPEFLAVFRFGTGYGMSSVRNNLSLIPIQEKVFPRLRSSHGDLIPPEFMESMDRIFSCMIGLNTWEYISIDQSRFIETISGSIGKRKTRADTFYSLFPFTASGIPCLINGHDKREFLIPKCIWGVWYYSP